MNVDEIRNYVKASYVSQVEVCVLRTVEAVRVRFMFKLKNGESHLLYSSRGEPRESRSLNAAGKLMHSLNIAGYKVTECDAEEWADKFVGLAQ